MNTRSLLLWGFGSMLLNAHDLFFHLILLSITTSWCNASVNPCTLAICLCSCNNTALHAAWMPVMTNTEFSVLWSAVKWSIHCKIVHKFTPLHFLSASLVKFWLSKCLIRPVKMQVPLQIFDIGMLYFIFYCITLECVNLYRSHHISLGYSFIPKAIGLQDQQCIHRGDVGYNVTWWGLGKYHVFLRPSSEFHSPKPGNKFNTKTLLDYLSQNNFSG